ncbi:hypothetical protein DNI29_04505 [Hymenobacter sediminis]|uniref:hypothetical protein n=1 Tax=Hymenobacter sediminis TaxID=2218621 RepID=UPI000DA65E76|nr:hypothetical protein [Hymenobacter sediminis]RPD50064.1 hypothetical protein DNI29_04505 [Hymenobacter sediminis]
MHGDTKKELLQLATLLRGKEVPDLTPSAIPPTERNETLAATVQQQEMQLNLAGLNLADLATKYTNLANLYQQSQTKLVQAEATIAAHTTSLADKLSRAGDTSTGQQIGPDGMTNDAFITNRQVAIGVKRPVAVGFNIGTANTPLTPALIDPLGQNRKAVVLKVYLFMTTAAIGLGPTVKIGPPPGGSEIKSQTYLLTGLPGVNKLLELSPEVLTVLPVGSTIYATASSGKWAVFVDCLFTKEL